MKQFKTNTFTLTIFESAESSFFVTTTLIEKDGKAALINANFTQTESMEVVRYLKENQLDLESIYLIHGDPDFYFGLETIKANFPQAIAYASQSTFEHILHSVQGKLAVWGPQLGDDTPQNVVLPKIYTEETISLVGETFAFVGDDRARIGLYHEGEKVLLTGIDVFDSMHAFLADTATKDAMEDWMARLDSLLNLDVETVIAGHASPTATFDQSAIVNTKTYLENAIEVMSTVSDSAAFIQEMSNRYPDYVNQGVLSLSAKVVMGEMS